MKKLGFGITPPPFYKPSQEKIIMKLFHYKKPVTNRKVARDILKNGLHLANLYEILALAKKYPDLQREFAIFALGSQCLIDNTIEFPVFVFGTDPKYDTYWPTPRSMREGRGVRTFRQGKYSYGCLYAGVKIIN